MMSFRYTRGKCMKALDLTADNLPLKAAKSNLFIMNETVKRIIADMCLGKRRHCKPCDCLHAFSSIALLISDHQEDKNNSKKAALHVLQVRLILSCLSLSLRRLF